jgi:hypothetical protein
MLPIRHAVDLACTRQELEALSRYAHEDDVDKGGHYDARPAAINIRSHRWHHPRHTRSQRSSGVPISRGTRLGENETDEGFSLDDPMRGLGRLELQPLG